MMDIRQTDDLIRKALEEDIGWGDVTTQATVPDDRCASAHLIAKTSWRRLRFAPFCAHLCIDRL